MGKLILLIDDEKDLRDVLSLFVKMVFPEITFVECSNGREGLATAKSDKPDLIIVDYKMPDLNGLEVIQELRCSVVTEAIPVILYTGFISEVNKTAIKNLGKCEIISKPMPMQALKAKIASYMLS